jgi:hypothetical protein
VSRVLKVMMQAAISVPLCHGKFCEYDIWMEWFRGMLFFMRGWEAMVRRLGLEKDDIIVFELDINCFNFTLIRAHPYIQPHMKCKRHGMTVAKGSWLAGVQH